MSETYVHIDGMSIVALCRLGRINASRRHRVTLNDFIWPLLSQAANSGWRVCYVGSTRSVLTKGCGVIRDRLPALKFAAYQGYFDVLSDSGQVAHTVAESRPDLVLVGMGMGRQERWTLDNLTVLAPACILTVGACMEYIAGEVRTPPRWMGRMGLEWLFRLAENPSRFWHRYLVEPWFVLGYILWYYSLSERARNACRAEEWQLILAELNSGRVV